jgi:RHH-type proline utilization regulon transcriptional repressor/proline dehydrogenase/delta 1-pyrroline-5-carboxylate dehydrogenase
VSAVRALPNVRSLTQSHSDAAFASAVASGPSTRVRLIGGDVSALYSAVGGRPDVAVYGEPVTEAGRLEILPFVREQAVSITAHRFGTPNHLTDALI